MFAQLGGNNPETVASLAVANLTPQKILEVVSQPEGTFEVSKPREASKIMAVIFEKDLDKYTDPRSPEYKPYHNESHTAQVVKAGIQVFETLEKEVPYYVAGMTPGAYFALSLEQRREKLDLNKAYLSAILMGHDVVQQGTEQPNGKLLRKRGIGDDENEGASALRTFEILQKFKTPEGKLMFKDYPLSRVQADIHVTEPKFIAEQSSADTLALKQANLTGLSNWSGVIMAFCDMKAAAISGDQRVAVATGDAELLELNPKLYRMLGQPWDSVVSNPEELKYVRDTTLAWLRIQPGFFEYQRQDLEERLGNPSDGGIITDDLARQALREVFKPERMRTVVDASRERYEYWKARLGEGNPINAEDLKTLVNQMVSHESL